jgi:hypothetical protein
MNGKISVKSKLGKGAEFKVKVPLEISNDLTTMVDEIEVDDFDFANYEFLIFNNSKSYGIS